MEHSFEIKCRKCGGIAVDIEVERTATFSMKQGTSVRIKFICLFCAHEYVMTITTHKNAENSITKSENNSHVYKDGEKYRLNGKKYRKIGRFEVIKKGAMQSWWNHELQPIQNLETIGDIPDNFSPERDFFNPV